jgi:hypothetical protein
MAQGACKQCGIARYQPKPRILTKKEGKKKKKERREERSIGYALGFINLRLQHR